MHLHLTESSSHNRYCLIKIFPRVVFWVFFPFSHFQWHPSCWGTATPFTAITASTLQVAPLPREHWWEWGWGSTCSGQGDGHSPGTETATNAGPQRLGSHRGALGNQSCTQEAAPGLEQQPDQQKAPHAGPWPGSGAWGGSGSSLPHPLTLLPSLCIQWSLSTPSPLLSCHDSLLLPSFYSKRVTWMNNFQQKKSWSTQPLLLLMQVSWTACAFVQMCVSLKTKHFTWLKIGIYWSVWLNQRSLGYYLLNQSAFVLTDWNQSIHVCKHWAARPCMTCPMWENLHDKQLLRAEPNQKKFCFCEAWSHNLCPALGSHMWSTQYPGWRGAVDLCWSTSVWCSRVGKGRAELGIHYQGSCLEHDLHTDLHCLLQLTTFILEQRLLPYSSSQVYCKLCKHQDRANVQFWHASTTICSAPHPWMSLQYVGETDLTAGRSGLFCTNNLNQALTKAKNTEVTSKNQL